MRPAILLATLILPAAPLADLPAPPPEEGFVLSARERVQIMAVINGYSDRVAVLEREVARLRGKTGCI